MSIDCPECGRTVAVNEQNIIAYHSDPNDYMTLCRGSGTSAAPIAATVERRIAAMSTEELVALAEARGLRVQKVPVTGSDSEWRELDAIAGMRLFERKLGRFYLVAQQSIDNKWSSFVDIEQFANGRAYRRFSIESVRGHNAHDDAKSSAEEMYATAVGPVLESARVEGATVEREACASLAKGFVEASYDGSKSYEYQLGALECAKNIEAAIRARNAK